MNESVKKRDVECREDHSSGEGFLGKVKMNKSALSIDKEWRGFFVTRRKGQRTCEKQQDNK
jgi:hypothetical protein